MASTKLQMFDVSQCPLQEVTFFLYMTPIMLKLLFLFFTALLSRLKNASEEHLFAEINYLMYALAPRTYIIMRKVEKIGTYILISVRLWNFKDGGS